MRNVVLYLILNFSVFAQMEFATFSRSANHLGQCERAGNITFILSSNLFPQASPESPIYLELSFQDSGVKLCQSLVNPLDPSTYQPIYLALSAIGDDPGFMAAPDNAVSIVRWIQGEKSIWLKINSPTSMWLTRNATFLELSEAHAVSFSIGLDTQETEDSALTEGSNLVMNALSDQTVGSTEIRLDLSGSQLGTSGEASLLYLDAVHAYDHTTQGVETQSEIQLGVPLELNQAAPRAILRGADGPQYNSRWFCPWVSWNEQFDSTIALQNMAAGSAQLRLTLRRGNEMAVTTRSLADWQSIRVPLGELFPAWERGVGASLEVEATEPNISVGWTTFLRQGCSQYSPATSLAIPQVVPDLYSGKTLGFTNLTTDPHFISAIVLLNLGSEPLDAELYLLGRDGNLQLLDSNQAKALEPLQPRAILIKDLLPVESETVQVFAHSSDGSMIGLTFLFNEQGDPAMQFAQKAVLPMPALRPK